MKIKKFKRKGKEKKIVILMLGIFGVTLSLLMGKTYAIYQSENEVTYTTSENTEVTNVEEALNDLYGKIGK